MLTSIKESYNQLLKSKKFKNEGFLCGFFLVSDINEIENSSWQIDFYEESSDTITSYMTKDEIEVSPKSEIFKEKSTKIEELNLEEVETNFNNTIKKAYNFLKKSKEEATKVIVILQKQNIPTWNISFITKNFNILNIKINATNGKFIDKKIVSIMNFKKE